MSDHPLLPGYAPSGAVITDYGPESLCTSGRDNTLVVAPDGKVSIGGPRQGKYQAPVGIPIDPSEWCEASHATCDCNPDVELPEWRWVEWQYGAHPMQTRERRPPRYCVACFDTAHEQGWDLNDWRTVEEIRGSEAATTPTDVACCPTTRSLSSSCSRPAPLDASRPNLGNSTAVTEIHGEVVAVGEMAK